MQKVIQVTHFFMCVCAGGHCVHTVSLSLISTLSSEKTFR